MKKNNIQKLIKEIEEKKSVSDKFHLLTSNKRNISAPKDIPQSWFKIYFKTYPRLDRVFFKNAKTIKSKLGKILIDRRSIRKFSGFSISKEELSYLLFSSSGLTHLGKTIDESKRPYPSAGGRYPLEIYPIILNCEGIEKGLYHYNVKENSLELLLKKDLDKWLTSVTSEAKWIEKSAVVFIITGVLNRTRIKYGDKGYRLALIETGHLSQNILLLATEMRLYSCPLGGFIDKEVNNLLDVDLQKEVALYMIAIGKL